MIDLEKRKLSLLLKDYLKNALYADDKFIYETINAILKSRKLKNYVSDIKINTSDKIGVAHYDTYDKVLQVRNINEGKNVLSHNIKLLHVLLHVCEHVDQCRTCKNENSINKILLDPCFKLNEYKEIKKQIMDENTSDEVKKDLISQTKYYKEYKKILNSMNKCLPSERQAEIDSYEKLILILSEVGRDYCKNSIFKVLKNYEARKLMGYLKEDDKIICPTQRFFEAIDSIEGSSEIHDETYKFLSEIFEEEPLSLRLYYGFPITKEEYDNQLSKLV